MKTFTAVGERDRAMMGAWPQRIQTFLARLLLVAGILAWIRLPAEAVPYASGITVVADTVHFFLNEEADNVTVILDGGAGTVDLGALPRGRHSFPLGGAAFFEIRVRKAAGPGFRQGVASPISSDTNILMRFVNQRGVAVNRNPASPYFGRIYVSVGQAGTNGASGRVLGDGIYVINPDQTDALGQGDAPLTGGLNWTNPPPNAESPHRLTVGPDDSLFICDWSDSNGSLYVTDADVANGQNLFDGPVGSAFPLRSTSGKIHGSIPAAVAEGSLLSGDLTVWVIDEDLQDNKDSESRTHINSIWRWDIGSGPLPVAGPPTRVASPLIGTASQLGDLVRGPDGKWYVSQRRAEPATSAGVFVLAGDFSQTLWNSRTATRELLGNPTANDLLGETAAIDVSSDGKYLAVLRRDTNSISILPLIDGIPDLTNRIVIPTSPTTGVARDIAFDRANNLYTVSSGQGLLRIYSPGGTSVASTASDGTFNVFLQELPKVILEAADAVAGEAGLATGQVLLTRTGDAGSPLTVNLTITGTAAAGVDYESLPASVTFGVGETTAALTITPLDDLVAERVETIVIALAPSADYSAVQPGLVSVALLDDEAPVLEVAPGDTNMFELHAADTGSFTITRLGETNIEIFAVNYLLSGAAEPGIDYTLPGELGGFTLAAGVVDYSLLVTPIDDSENEGDETITLTLDPDSPEYQVGASASATIRIRDNELPPARVLFADDFDSGAGENWTQVFGANNGIFDATVAFGHDYSQNGVGSAPRSSGGTTRGLFIQVNKQDATPGGSAAVNLYPTGREFRGNYALRFDMLLNFGAASTTEHALAGLNHSGLLTNRVTQSVDTNNTTRGGDGIWVAIETDGSANREYGAYSYSAPGSAPGLLTNRSAAAMSPFIPAPPYAFAGSPGNQGSGGNRVWAQVELRQLYGRIGLLINRALVYEFPNTSGFSAGTVMIGHNDQFDSIGSPEAYVLFDNVEVVSLDLEITGVSFPDGAMALDFVAPLGGAASSFTVESSPVLPATDWEPEPATIEATPTGFRAVIPRPNATRFLRIRN